MGHAVDASCAIATIRVSPDLYFRMAHTKSRGGPNLPSAYEEKLSE